MFFTTYLTRSVCCVLLVLASTSSADSLIPPQLKFKSVLTNQIEKLGYLNTIVQDEDGFLWFGAIQGLARYDGYEVKYYRADSTIPGSLPSNWIKSLLVTRDGHLWVVTHEGVCKFIADSDSFDCLRLPAQQSEVASATYYFMFEDSQGKYWLSTSLGLRIYDPVLRTFSKAPSALDNLLPPLPHSESNFVTDMVEQPNGNLWIGTYNAGIFFYNRASDKVHYFNTDDALETNKILDLMIDSRGVLWVGTLGNGLLYFNSRENHFNRLQHSASEKADTVWSVREDNQGLFWIGDGTGVHLYDPVYQKFAAYSYVEGLHDGPGNFVSRIIYHDKTGGTWIGYFPSGVDRIDQLASQFQNYRHIPSDPLSLADGGVISTLEDEHGNLWVGCGFGLSYLDRKMQTFTTLQHEENNPDSLSGSTVLDMDFDASGNLWIGAWDRGLNRLNRLTMTFSHFMEEADNPRSLFGREPWAVLVDSYDTLWVGTEKGLNRFDANTETFQKVMPLDANGSELANLYVREIYEDSRGMLWIGSFNGLFKLDPVSGHFLQHYKHDPNDNSSLSSDQVISIFEDREHALWVGTNGEGLNKIDQNSGQITRIAERDGLVNLNVSGILEDQLGSLWLSTYQGLTRYDKKNQSFTIFSEGDGPVGNLYNRNSASRLKSGELVFGSTRGLTIFNPLQLDKKSFAPPVAITRFSIFNKPVLPGENSVLKKSIVKTEYIELQHDDSVFSFEFSALDFNSPAENRYSYRLSGFEESWNNVGTKRDATYTNIDPGEYILQVRATNNNGVWSEQPRQIFITIKPPWWDTPWAWIAYILLALGGLYRIMYVNRSKLTYERTKLEQERAIVKQLKEIDQMKDQINKELDIKVEERTEALRREHKNLVNAQRELKLLNAKLEEMSVTDILTGLKNRRFLYQSIDADIAMLTRQWSKNRKLVSEYEEAEGLTFVILDIDHFKRINDKFGHAAGDSALEQLSKILLSNVRDSDYVIRWGGEEFVIVLRHLPRSASFIIAQRIYSAVKGYKVTLNDDAIVDIRCSMGMAFYPFLALRPTALSWEQVLNLADQALYCAKDSGRDSWVSVEAPSEIEEPEKFANLLLNEGIANPMLLKQLEIRSSKPRKSLTWFAKTHDEN